MGNLRHPSKRGQEECGGDMEAGSHSQWHMWGTTGISASSSAISSPFAEKEIRSLEQKF